MSLVNVIAAPHPFRQETADFAVPAGGSIAEILTVVQADPILRRHAHVFVGDCYVPRSAWTLVRPKAGVLVTVRIVPGGGRGKNPLRTILTIATIAAASFFAPGLGGVIAGATGLSVPVATSIASSLIIGGGVLLTNLIAPIKPPSAESRPTESPSYYLDAARNAKRSYSPVPVILGRHRVVPPLGANVVTEVVGDTNRLRFIVVWGFGPLRVTDIRIGETPITEFEHRIQTLEGRTTDNTLGLYPSDIDQQSPGVTLTEEAGFVVRRSVRDADELSIDISLPRGLVHFNNRGARALHRVKLEIQFRRVGDTQWQHPVFTAMSGGEAMPLSGDIWQLEARRSEPMRYGFRWSTPRRDQYDVRVRRASPDEDEEATEARFSTLVWSALRTITNRAPLNIPRGLAVSALDIQATEQLQGAVDTLNGIVESEVLDWDGGSWTPAFSRNPASMFRAVLQHPARLRTTPNRDIDLSALERFHGFCETNDYRFDMIIDARRSLYDVLSDICAAARASPDWRDGKWTVIVDDGVQPYRQHFTEVNSANLEMRRLFVPPPHGIRVSFPNEEKDWQRDERVVYDDNHNEATAENLASIDPPGITNPAHAYKWARFHLAQTLLRREVWTITVPFEYLVAGRGSKVSVQHPTLAVGIASARVVSTTLNAAGSVTAIGMDAPIRFSDAGPYGVKVRTRTNRHYLATIQNPGADAVDTVVLSAALDADIQPGSLMSVGVLGAVATDGLITGIEPADEETARLTIVPYQEGIYNAETGPIPPFDSNITPASDRLPALTVESIISDRSALRKIGPVTVDAAILVQVRPVNVHDAAIEVLIRSHASGEPFQAADIRSQSLDHVRIGGVEEEIAYDLRLRWTQRTTGRVGPWTEVTHTVGEIEQFAARLQIEYAYTRTTSSDPPDNIITTEQQRSTTGYLPPGATSSPLGTSAFFTHEWWSVRTGQNGLFEEFHPWRQWEIYAFENLVELVNEAMAAAPAFTLLQESVTDAASRAEHAALTAEQAETAVAGSIQAAAGSAEAAHNSALAAGNSARSAASSASTSAASAGTASGEAASARASAIRAAAAELTATSASAAALVTQEAAATLTDTAAEAIAGIDLRVSAAVANDLSTTYAAAVVLRAQAGVAEATLELVALSDLDGARTEAVINATLRSDSYSPGLTGWQISRDGTMDLRAIAADRLTADVRNAEVLWRGDKALSATSWTWFGMSENLNDFDALLMTVRGDVRADGYAVLSQEITLSHVPSRSAPASGDSAWHVRHGQTGVNVQFAGGRSPEDEVNIAITRNPSGTTLYALEYFSTTAWMLQIIGIKNPISNPRRDSGTTSGPVDPPTTPPTDPTTPPTDPTTPPTDPTTPPDTTDVVPSVPTSVTLVPFGTSFNFSWSAPATGTNIEYRVERITCTTDKDGVRSCSEWTFVIITTLLSYRFSSGTSQTRVRAENSAGVSAWVTLTAPTDNTDK